MRSMKILRAYRMSSLLILAAAAAAAAAGCAGAPQRVMPVGEDAFRVSAAAPRFGRQADANYKALSAAAAFCSQTGGRVLFRQSQESGVHSWSPKREDLTFVCTRSEDSGTLQASLR